MGLTPDCLLHHAVFSPVEPHTKTAKKGPNLALFRWNRTGETALPKPDLSAVPGIFSARLNMNLTFVNNQSLSMRLLDDPNDICPAPHFIQTGKQKYRSSTAQM